MSRALLVFTIAMIAAAVLATPSIAHQTASSNGARVTMHVNPDDEPQAGQTSLIKVTRVRVPRGGSFRFSSCGCRLRITDSTGRMLTSRAMRSRASFTFPRAGAYRLTYSGSYRRSGKRKRFSTSFAIRAY